MENNVYFAIDMNHDKCKIWTTHAEFANKAEWNIFGIPKKDLYVCMNIIATRVNNLGYACFFYLF